MTHTAIEARGVTRDLPGPVPVTLVRDIDLTIGRGEFVAVTGPSGSGKSSLLYLLGLLDVPTAGSISLLGRQTGGLTPDAMAELRLASIGFVFQFHFLLPEFTCQANVEIPIRRLGNLSDSQARQRAAGLLDSLELADHRRKYPDQLSGGQRQRVAIARALANDPPLILADEPTGNLDTRTAHLVFELFRDLAHRQSRTVVVVTHDAELAQTADRRIHLVDGRIVD
ncbi:putative transporter subunit: ATP-binding component of ABC superfamily transporter [Magnetospirillum sp. XM-1]|uniref:ABC transporter ATP-binding protein n=1 Tax=Magnetospirillum sp. XM-1 TaxID=1663591 RepID=UPI00073DD9BA|nr:ABC transporter ATP-binding protein [Magnetospirillum sp. XM-1]CUW40636.1 putative transporter subunit: ATP-binding component of ABC superfamily transporter [Magnetospirillum sp. XM-1]